MCSIHIHPERLLKRRSPHKVKNRMKGISRSRPQIQLLRILHRRRRLHSKHIRVELVCTHIRLVKDRIIKVKVKPGHGIRNLHVKLRLVRLNKLSFVRSSHHYGRIKILSAK